MGGSVCSLAGAALWGFWEEGGSVCDSESLLGLGLCPDEDQSCSLKGHKEPGYMRAAQETRLLTLCQDPCRDCFFCSCLFSLLSGSFTAATSEVRYW